MADRKSSGATQQFVPVKEIRNGIIVLKDGSYRGVLIKPQTAFLRRVGVDPWGFGKVAKGDSADVMAHLGRQMHFARIGGFSVTPENRGGIETICELGQKYGFKTYFAMTPLYEGACADSGIAADIRMVLNYLDSLEVCYPDFHVLGPFPVPETLDRMDGALDHPSFRAAEDYTRTIIRRLKARPEMQSFVHPATPDSQRAASQSVAAEE